MKASPCLEIALSPDEWVYGAELNSLEIRNREDERAVTIIARDFAFTCAGSVRQWQIRWNYRDASPGCARVTFDFFALRQSESCGTTTLQGHNCFSVVVDSSGRQSVQSVFDVDRTAKQRVRVQEGDFIAVTMSLTSSTSCPNIRARVAGVKRAGGTIYHRLFDSYAQALLPSLVQPCTSYTAENLIKPFFTAVIGK